MAIEHHRCLESHFNMPYRCQRHQWRRHDIGNNDRFYRFMNERKRVKQFAKSTVVRNRTQIENRKKCECWRWCNIQVLNIYGALDIGLAVGKVFALHIVRISWGVWVCSIPMCRGLRQMPIYKVNTLPSRWMSQFVNKFIKLMINQLRMFKNVLLIRCWNINQLRAHHWLAESGDIDR